MGTLPENNWLLEAANKVSDSVSELVPEQRPLPSSTLELETLLPEVERKILVYADAANKMPSEAAALLVGRNRTDAMDDVAIRKFCEASAALSQPDGVEAVLPYLPLELRKKQLAVLIAAGHALGSPFAVPPDLAREARRKLGWWGYRKAIRQATHESRTVAVADSIRFVVVDILKSLRDLRREILAKLGAAADGKAEPAALALMVGDNAATATKQVVDGKTPADTEADMQRLAEAVGDKTAAEIIRIASGDNMTADAKMLAILALDKRYVSKSSGDWATLLRVDSAAIRKTKTWRTIQANVGQEP